MYKYTSALDKFDEHRKSHEPQKRFMTSIFLTKRNTLNQSIPLSKCSQEAHLRHEV